MAMNGAVKNDNIVAKSMRNLMCDPRNAIVIIVPLITTNNKIFSVILSDSLLTNN